MAKKPLRQFGLAAATAAALTFTVPSNANAQAAAVATVGTGAGGAFVAVVTSPVVLGTVTILTGIVTIWAFITD